MNGPLLSQHWGRWRARFAVRVTSAVDLSELSGYAELTQAGRYARAHEEDIGYLARLCGDDPNSAFEARWLVTRGEEPSLTLLGRVDRPDRERAEADGWAAGDRLVDVPAHVRAEYVKNDDEVSRAFLPFEPHPRGIAEVRRTVTVARPERPDAPVRSYVMVSPFCSAPQRWLLGALVTGLLSLTGLIDGAVATFVTVAAALGSAVIGGLLVAALGFWMLHRLSRSAPVLISVTVKPTRVAPEFASLLNDVAGAYGKLAQPGEFRPGGLYARPVRLSPDPIAATAESLYRDAAARLFGWVVNLRVTIASPVPLDDELAQSLADLLGGVLERPAGQAVALLRAGVTALEIPRWGGHVALPAALRSLSELADHAEAANAFWLPAAATGTLPGFGVCAPEPQWGPVRFEHSNVTIVGDVIGRDQHNHD